VALPNAGKPDPIRKAPDAEPAVPVVPARPSMRDLHSAWRNTPPALPPGLAGGPDLPSLVKALRRRWMVALSIGLVAATGAAAAVYFLMSPKYTAFSQVHVSSNIPTIMRDAADAGRGQFNTYRKTQAARMKSRFVLTAALKREEVKNLAVVRDQPDPIVWLEEELRTETPEESEYTSLTMSGIDPEALVKIVSAVTNAYLQEVNQEEPRLRSQRLAELEDILTKANQKLKQKKELFKQRAEELGSSYSEVLAQKQVGLRNNLNEYSRQHAQVQGKLRELQVRLNSYKAQEDALSKVEITEAALNEALESDPQAKEILANISRLQNWYSKNAPIYKDQNESTLIEVRAQIARLKKSLEEGKGPVRTEVAKRLQQQAKARYKEGLALMQTEHALAEENEKSLREQVEKLTREADAIGKSSVELDQLRAEIKLEDDLIEKVGQQKSILEVELRSPLRIALAQEAGLQRKDTKRWMMAMVGGPFAAFMFCCVGVALLEFRSRRIQTSDEVVTGLGMRVVGSIPAMGTGTDALAEHELLESIDGIRTLLLKDASIEATRVVLVTSAVSGEGKTTLASHLATSLARAGRKTLFIDCDLRRPAAHQLFELPMQPGFSEVLMNEVHVAEAIRATPVEGLWMMPAGQWDREVIQALARDGVAELFDKLKGEYDFIIVDSHPVLPATDSLLIAQHVDAVLLSLLRDVSQTPRVYAASQRLGTLGIRILGAVVNGTRPDDYGGGYQYDAPAARAA